MCMGHLLKSNRSPARGTERSSRCPIPSMREAVMATSFIQCSVRMKLVAMTVHQNAWAVGSSTQRLALLDRLLVQHDP